MSASVPSGWSRVTLSSIADIETGRTPATKNPENYGGKTPFIKPPDIHAKLIDTCSATLSKTGVEQARIAPHGSVLVTCIGNLGRSGIAQGDVAYNQQINAVLPTLACSPSWIRWQVSSSSFQRLMEENSSGTTVTIINKSRFGSLPFLIAPLNEQRRIVDKIDALFAHSKKAKESLDRIPALLDKLKKSILAAAFRGDLTRDWRAKNPDVEPAEVLLERIRQERRKRWEEAELAKMRAKGKAPKNDKWKAKYEKRHRGGRNVEKVTSIPGRYALAVNRPERAPPDGWEWVSLLDVAELESGHTPSRKRAEYWDGDIAWIGIKDAREHSGGVIHETKQMVTQLGLDNSAARLLPKDTVCLSRTASVGYVVVMGREMATSQDFVNFVCSDALIPEYLMYLFLAEGKDGLRDFGKGTTHTTIYYPEVRAFHIALPPVEEQRLVVERLRAALGKLGAVERAYVAGVRRYEHINQAILAKAFRGELVPQDPEDEPASALLERLRSEREAEAAHKPKRGRGSRAAKKAKAPATQASTEQVAGAAGRTNGEALALLESALAQMGSLSSADARNVTGLSAAEVRPLLQKLCEKGVAEKTGKGRGTKYVGVQG